MDRASSLNQANPLTTIILYKICIAIIWGPGKLALARYRLLQAG